MVVTQTQEESRGGGQQLCVLQTLSRRIPVIEECKISNIVKKYLGWANASTNYDKATFFYAIMSAYFSALMNGNVNLSIASLPLTLLLPAISHWYSIGVAQKNKVQGGWTNQNPRAFVARLNAKAAMGKKLSDVEELVLRGQAAQQNGFEWWAVWAVAVVLGHLAKIPKQEMDRYTLVHVTARMLFYYLYLTTKTRRSSYWRTLVFQVTLLPALVVFVRASRILI